MRWPEGPPHLALNPPYFWCLFRFRFVFFFCFCLFGGFKGSVSVCVCVFFGGVLSFLLFKRQETVSPPPHIEKHIFACLLSVDLAFSSAFFSPPLLTLILLLFLFLSFFLSFFDSFVVSLYFRSSLQFSFFVCCFLLFLYFFLVCWNNANIKEDNIKKEQNKYKNVEKEQKKIKKNKMIED